MNFTLALAAVVLLGGAPQTSPPPKAAPTEKPSRLQLARDGWKLASGRYQAGAAPIEELVRWCQWLYDAERAVEGDGARTQHLARLRELEATVDKRVQTGLASPLDLMAVRYLLATAEAAAK
jgi:hypothetical protein